MQSKLPEGFIRSKFDDRTKLGKEIEKFPYNGLSYCRCKNSQNNRESMGTIHVISELYGITSAHVLIDTTKEFAYPFEIQ